MKIFDLSIKNYRGIDSLENLNCGELNTYVGKNDSGKSTILNALSAFFNNSFSQKDVFYGKPEDEKVEIKVRFTLDFSVHPLALDQDNKMSIIKRFYYNSSGKLKIEQFYECYDVNNPDYQNCWDKKETGLNTILQALGVEYSRSGRGVTNLSKIEQINNTTLTLGRVLVEHPIKDFLKNIASNYPDFEYPEYSFFDAEQNLNIGASEFQSQFKPIATESLDKNQGLTQQIETNVKSDLESELNEITTLMQKNVPDLEKINADISCNWKNLVKFDLSLKFQSETFTIPISHKGTGFKRLLMVAYFEYLAQKGNKRNQIFGIEEPETYLHPKLQRDLLTSIITLAEDSQFFLTTHSPIFAGATESSNIVVVKKESQISKYYNHQSEDDILDMVIQELGIRPNYNLLNSDYQKVVFVEGSNDCTFWQIALEKIHGSLPSNILFVPCGGSQVEFFVNEKLCREINRRYIVIVDSDKGAIDYATKQEKTNEMRDKVLESGGAFQVLRKRAIENYYNVNAIRRLLQGMPNFSEDDFSNFVIGDYTDVKQEIKTHIHDQGLHFKAKNNMEIFREMTRDEWIESSKEEAGSTDLEIIIQAILG